MRKIIFIPLLSLLFFSTSHGEELAVKQLIEAFDTDQKAFYEKLSSLPREEQRAFYQNMPKPEATAKQLIGFLDTNFSDPQALEALTWLSRQGRRIRDLDFTVNEALLERVAAHHLNHEALGEFCIGLSRNEQAKPFLNLVVDKSTDKQAQGSALYALAAGLERNPEASEQYVALVDRIIADHPDLSFRGGNLTERLKGKRFAAQHLAIGKKAPEIEGQDVDGNSLKLSDFHGKVVVIDFWGDW